MLFSFLALGTIWFWLYLIIPFILLVWFVESEQSFMAALTIIGMVIAFLAFGDSQVVRSFLANPFVAVPYAIGYVVLGVVWSFVKWFFFLLRERDRYLADLTSTQKARADQESRGIDENRLSSLPNIDLYRPKASENKGRIVFWMTYWPASAFWTLLNDPLTRLFNFIYRRLGKAFDGMSKAVFARYES